MTTKRPRIVGFAVISREGMIAGFDGSFPEELKIPADQKFYHDAMDRAVAVAHGRHSFEGGPGEAARRRIILTRRVDRVIADPRNPKAVLWNPASAPFEEALLKLDVADGTLAVVGGTDVFGLFLNIGYDAFFLTRTQASVPQGRPLFPGIGRGTTPEDVLKRHGLVLRNTRMLDETTDTKVEEWGPKA